MAIDMGRRPRRRRRPRTAVVLSGGGNLGAIQVGQLRALAERDIVPDLIVGCSVGALNGGAFAVDPTMAGVRRLESIWLDLADQPDSLMPGSWIPSPLMLVRKGSSIHSNAGLRSTIERFLDDTDEFEELAVPFQCVATDVDSGAETWFETGPIVDPVLASAALPAVYPIVEIGDRRFLDGGVVNNVPLARAVHLGARRIYVLHVGLHGKPSPEVRRPADAALIAYWIARNSRFARDLADLPRNVEAVVLPPGDRPEIRYDDFSRTEELMQQGYSRAVEYLDQLDAADADARDDDSLPDRAEQLRADLVRVIDELRGKVVDRFGGHAATEEPAGPHDHDGAEPDHVGQAPPNDHGDLEDQDDDRAAAPAP